MGKEKISEKNIIEVFEEARKKLEEAESWRIDKRRKQPCFFIVTDKHENRKTGIVWLRPRDIKKYNKNGKTEK